MNKFESSSAISKGLGNALQTIADIGSLPAIRGRWFFVDPYKGADTSSGKTIDTAVASLSSAYEKCLDEAGDGICILSAGDTAAETSSYLKTAMTWAKDGITVVGIGAPVKMFKRARISNKQVTTTAAMTVVAGALKVITRAAGSFITDGWEVGMTLVTAGDQTVTSVVTAVAALSITVTDNLTASAAGISSITSSVPILITLTGTNNSFYNLGFWNGGTAAADVGGIKITGHRNYFRDCHIVGGAGAASANQYSVLIEAGEENTFENCVIGTDTVDRGDNADAELILKGKSARNRFKGCEFLSWVTAGTAHGAIHSNGTNGGRVTLFENCVFNSLYSTTTPADVHLVTGTVSKIAMKSCACYNFTGWGASVAVDNAATAASAAGGIATTE